MGKSHCLTKMSNWIRTERLIISTWHFSYAKFSSHKSITLHASVWLLKDLFIIRATCCSTMLSRSVYFCWSKVFASDFCRILNRSVAMYNLKLRFSTYPNPLSKHELSKFCVSSAAFFSLPFLSNTATICIRKVVLNEHCSLVCSFVSFSFSALIRRWSHSQFSPWWGQCIRKRKKFTEPESKITSSEFDWPVFFTWYICRLGAMRLAVRPIGDITTEKQQQRQQQTNDPSVIRANESFSKWFEGLEMLSWKCNFILFSIISAMGTVN